MKRIISLILVLVLAMSLAACGAKETPAPSVDLNALYEGYTAYLPDMFFPDDATLMTFLGIDAADCTQYKVALSAAGMETDEVWLIEAKDTEALERLKTLAQTRIEAKLDETVTYAPDQYVIVEKAELLTNGLYLALLICDDVDTMKASFEAAFQ